jgi:hypothetical protein
VVSVRVCMSGEVWISKSKEIKARVCMLGEELLD